MSAKPKDPLAWYVSPDIRFHLFMPLAALAIWFLTRLFFGATDD